MRMAMIGLGRMGGNMARRLCRGDIEVVGYDRSPDVVDTIAKEDGLIAADSLADAIGKLEQPRVVWQMLPSGDLTEEAIQTLRALLSMDILFDERMDFAGGTKDIHRQLRELS